MKNLRFEELNLSSEVLKAIEDKGFEETTPIQAQAIPCIMEGRDVIGQAQTGTGKTAAFGIPILEKLNHEEKVIQAMIICPTRELAIQVAEEIRELGKFKKGIGVLPIYGGQPIDRQIKALQKRPQIIVGTPGRVMDHMNRGTLKMDKVRMVVLDEADEMLDMGFIDDIKYITSRLNEKRQSLFFSATMNRKSEDIANTLLKNPVRVEIETQQAGKNVDQDIVRVRSREEKVAQLTEYLKKDEFEKVLIFTRTKREADRLSDKLFDAGIKTGALHGNKGQGQRSRIIESFKRGNLSILIATDIASRGLDVNNITHVINYDVPENFDDYIHRIGRTGRAGKKGIAITFVG